MPDFKAQVQITNFFKEVSHIARYLDEKGVYCRYLEGYSIEYVQERIHQNSIGRDEPMESTHKAVLIVNARKMHQAIEKLSSLSGSNIIIHPLYFEEM